MYLCFAEYCKDDGEREKWIEEQRPWCDEHAGVTLPAYHDVVDSWTPERRAALKRLSADEAQEWPTLDEVVVPEAHFFDRAYTTMVLASRLSNILG